MATERTAYELALLRWVEAVVDAGVIARFANNEAPRPDGTYVNLQVISHTQQGHAEHRTDAAVLGGGHEKRLRHHEMGTVSVQTYGVNARALMDGLRRSIERADIIEANNANGVAVYQAGDITDLTDLQGAQYEPAFNCDFAFRHSTVVTHETTVIETIRVDSPLTATIEANEP